VSVVTRLSALWKNFWEGGQAKRALDVMVLETLDTLGPSHGYSLAARLEQFSGGALSPNGGTLYVQLKRLEQRGLVHAKWDVTDSQRKIRFYAITVAGRHHLVTAKGEFDRKASITHRLLRAHDQQKRELEIARAVQERLFPQDYPDVSGLDYAGACRPALEVGGDYYDFICFSNTEFGIAIGDVSGKGVSASLLMATLRAYLRGLTALGTSDLPTVMSNLNRFVFESSATNRYASFFYAQYDASTNVLEYVNGGHPPPLLFSLVDGHSRVRRLETGGPVIGLMPDCSYDQGRVTLEPGDVLVAFTDGISEAMNVADLEWGDARLTAAIESRRALAAMDLIRHIMTQADIFVADAPQHDDMTLVVVRRI
jgi:serine phosphatase RsbU (regulator of sigma subunit)